MDKLSEQNESWLQSISEVQSDSRAMIHADDVRMKLIEMESKLKQANNNLECKESVKPINLPDFITAKIDSVHTTELYHYLLDANHIKPP